MMENGTLLHNTNGLVGSAEEETPISKDGSCLASWRETLVVTGSFMAAYTAYLAIQSLQSSLNQEAGLGVVSLACLYGTIILSGILTPSFLRLVGAKWALVVGWVCHTLYTASNFYPTWATLIPSSILLGAIAGPMWTSQGLYITANGERLSKKSRENLHTVLSRLNGVFFMCYESTQITGNLISSLVLNQGSYSDSGNVTRTCGADDCPTVANATAIAEPEPHIVYILLGVFLVCDVVALGLTVFLLPPLQQKESVESRNSSQDQGLGHTLVSWCTALADPKLLFLVIFFVSSSMSQGILFVDFTKSFISCPLGVSMVGFIMASHGVVTSVVAVVTSRAAKYTGRYVLFGLAIVSNTSMLITLLLWEPKHDNLAPFFTVAAIWGAAVGIFHTQMNVLVGLLFPDKKESAFANYHTWTAIGFTITFGYGGALCVRTKLYICVTLVGLGILGYIAAEVFYARQSRAACKEATTCDEDERTQTRETQG